MIRVPPSPETVRRYPGMIVMPPAKGLFQVERTMSTVEIDRTLNEWHDEMREIRRDFHAHPELCFEENRTSSILKEKLAQWNIQVVGGLALTGVVGIIKGRLPGSGAIGLRADMEIGRASWRERGCRNV